MFQVEQSASFMGWWSGFYCNFSSVTVCLYACMQPFCWLCGAATGTSHTWTEISGHSCGRYKEEADRKIDEAQRNVKRYMHYYSRWYCTLPHSCLS